MRSTAALLILTIPYLATGESLQNYTAHEEICLSKNGSITSLLQGIFMDNGINRDEYNTVEFISVNADLEDPLYIWYHDGKWWLSPVDYMTKEDSDPSAVDVYGYCRGGEIGWFPACEECWVFFWEMLPLKDVNSFWEFKTKSFMDCSFSLSIDLTVCEDAEDSSGYETDVEYPNKWCVNGIGDVPSLVEPLIGTYERRSADHYRHVSHALYMWHDVMMNLWFIGVEMGTSPVLLCHPQIVNDNGDQTTILSGCILWDAAKQRTTEMDDVLSVGTKCGIFREDRKRGMSKGVIMGIVGAILLGIIGCFMIVYCGLAKDEDSDQEHDAIEMKETEMGSSPMASDATKSQQTTLQKKLSKLDTLDAQRFAHVPQETYDMDALNVRDEVPDTADPLTDHE